MVQVCPFHRCAEVSEVPRLLLVFPTATHAEPDTQDAAFRLLAAAPGGLDMRWMLQVRPVHRSASVAGDWLLNRLGLESPTARQPVAEVHATPYSWPITPPARPGMGWTAQLVPFQRSARVPMLDHTAVQRLAEVHDTPFRVADVALVPVGVDWSDQLVPFQPSARVPEPSVPTAVHAVVDVQETPLRLLSGTAGVLWIDQVVPFQRSTNSTMFLALFSKYPTAVHAVDEVHDTP